MAHRASVLKVFWPAKRARGVKDDYRLCARCGAWTCASPHNHDALCFAIETNARLLNRGLMLAYVAPSSKGRGDEVAKWPRRADMRRGERTGYEATSTRSQFTTYACYTKKRPTGNHTTFDDNRELIEKLRKFGYSNNEITLALWSAYDQ